MQPTIDTQLAAVRRSLAALAGEQGLSAEADATLGDAAKALERVERSWALVLPYLVCDNAALGELLSELAPRLPEDLRAEIKAATASEISDQLDVAAADERNEALRGLLARAIVATEHVRGPALGFLRESVERRPW